MAKTITEINEKIRAGSAVVLNASEVIEFVREKGVKTAAQEVDVVTTGTFGPMCSSGAYFNLGHSRPRIKLGGGRVTLNDVPAYTGFAAVDILMGATALPEDDPKNKVYPGTFAYGGGHVIEELVAGKKVKLSAVAYGTDCYPKKALETWVGLQDMNEAILLNPRNAYQNYNVAVNLGEETIYTYMGVLLPKARNANYSTAGQLSPLFNDPFYRTIGIGTRIFLGGGIGYVYAQGTQHNPSVPRTDHGLPTRPAATLALTGDLKTMNSRFLRGVSFTGYGSSLSVGVGVPIPILDEEALSYTLVANEDIISPIVDYCRAYPEREPEVLGEVSFKELISGRIRLEGREVPTGGLSSYFGALEIAETLKSWIKEGRFLLTEPVARLPGPEDGFVFKALEERAQ